MEESKIKESPLKSSNGFTLIELIAVLTIVGVIASITVRRVIAVETTAIQQSLNWAISELNTREALTWSKTKISDTNWVDDLTLYTSVDYNLGPEHIWNSRTPSDGKLSYKGEQIKLKRTPSNTTTPGRWGMK